MIRPVTDADRQFILSSWSASLRSSRDIPLISMTDWAVLMRPVIDRVYKRALTLVACHDTDQTILFGFISYRNETYQSEHAPLTGHVFYVFVKQAYRRAGLARQLFDAAGIDPDGAFGYACRTRSSWEVMRAKKCPAAKYDPFFARYDALREKS